MIGRVGAYLAAFEAITPDRLADFDDLVADEIRFRDPFNDVVGRNAFRRVLEKMFADLDDVRFEILRTATDGEVAFALWRFEGRMRHSGRRVRFEGMSELHVDADGRIAAHIDHWDASTQLYAKLPGLGRIIRWIRGRIGASPPA